LRGEGLTVDALDEGILHWLFRGDLMSVDLAIFGEVQDHMRSEVSPAATASLVRGI
jgi:hypothetical protein